MELIVETIEESKRTVVSLEHVGACYPDDDVIYFASEPYKLSSVRSLREDVDKFDILAQCLFESDAGMAVLTEFEQQTQFVVLLREGRFDFVPKETVLE